MRRKTLIVLLSLGAVLGFGFGTAHLIHGPFYGDVHRFGHGTRRASFEAQIAEVCTEAAGRVFAERYSRGELSDPGASSDHR